MNNQIQTPRRIFSARSLRRVLHCTLVSAFCSTTLLTTIPAKSAEKKELTWAVIELPPVTMFTIRNPADLSDLGNGSSDIATRAIAAHLPDYQHKVVSTSVAGVVSDMAAGKPLCVPSALRSPETEKVAYFTSRGISPPAHLVIRKANVERIAKGEKTVSLEKLLLRKDLFGSIGTIRPLGRGIDELVDKPQKQLKQIDTTKYGSLLQQVDAGRTDYTIEFPYVVGYFNGQSVFGNELVAIPLDEAVDLTTVYVACTRSPWGAQMIREIDKAIRSAIKEDKGIRTALLRWLPVNLQADYGPKFEAYFKQRLSESAPRFE